MVHTAKTYSSVPEHGVGESKENTFDFTCGGRIAADKAAAIADRALQNKASKRTASPGAEAMLYRPIPVLDHGFVYLVDYMGDDASVVQAARISYGAGTKHVQEDRGLIHYLLRHGHTTPFEMCEAKFHVFLPIFVAREWVRHRTANINEYSGRYSVMPHQYYVPQGDQICAQTSVNRQGRGDPLPSAQAERVQSVLHGDAQTLYRHYEDMLRGEAGTDGSAATGLTRELARMNLSVNFYTEWYWKIDLHNLMHFLALRADPHAQYEIRVYAEAMLDIMKAWVPLTFEAFLEYRKNATRLSASATRVLQRRLAGENVSFEESNLSKREWVELGVLFPEAFPALAPQRAS